VAKFDEGPLCQRAFRFSGQALPAEPCEFFRLMEWIVQTHERAEAGCRHYGGTAE
jgi:hypothetical protein